MTEFANKTEETLSQDPVPFLVDATATPAGSTPSALGMELGDLGRLSYIRGTVKAKVSLSQAVTAGAATLRLTDGANDFGSVSIGYADADANNDILVRFSADLVGASPAARLYLALDVGTAFDAGTEAAIFGALVVEHPVVVGSC